MIKSFDENTKLYSKFLVNGGTVSLAQPLKGLHSEIIHLSRVFLKYAKRFEKENGVKLNYLPRKLFCFSLAALIVYTRQMTNKNNALIKIFPGITFGEGKEKEWIEIQILYEPGLFRGIVPRRRDIFLAKRNEELFNLLYTLYKSDNVYDNLLQCFSSYTVYHFLQCFGTKNSERKKRFVISTPELYLWIKMD